MAPGTESPPPARLLLLWELPGGTSTRRVAVWRRLQRLGARSVGGAAYELPFDAESRESFEWLRAEIAAMGGRCALYEARELPAAGSAPAAPVGEPLSPADYRGRIWVTRPRPGIDRMASAWLIRRFVDPAARFEFVERAPQPGDGRVAFDMYGAELGHRAGRCTFEVICERFDLRAAGLEELGRLVRAVDLHEEAPDPPAAELVERLVAGLRAAHRDDGELLAAGIGIFEALHAAPPGRPPERLRGDRPPGRHAPAPGPAGRRKR